MLTPESLLREAEKRLAAAGIENPREAAYLFEHVFGMKHYDPRVELNEEKTAEFEALIERRVEGIPYQYLIGKAPFLDIDLHCGEGVLIPRPDTETLVEIAAKECEKNSLKRILDLCSGTGCIGIGIKRSVPGSDVTCVEKSEEAYRYLAKNCSEFCPDIQCVNADLFDFLPDHDGEYDLITCNPPYLTGKEMDELQKEVRYEPREALFGGDDGLDFYRRMKPYVFSALRDGGYVIFEGGDDQLDLIMEIYVDDGLFEGRIEEDQFGMQRFFAGRKVKTVSSDN